MATKKKAEAALVPVTETPETLLVMGLGQQLLGFIGQVKGFLTKATTLEQHAAQCLTEMRMVTAPRTADEDVVVQATLKDISKATKEIQEHWTITSAVHQFHRTLTARRDKGVRMLEEASEIGNRLHNDYTRRAREEAEREARRLREAEEARVRKEQEREAAELERQAMAAEAASPTITAREQRFVEAFVAGPYKGDGRGAATVAGCKNPAADALALLGRPKIQTAIQAAIDARVLKQQAEAKRAEPVHVQTEAPRAQIARAPGAHDRTTWSAEVLDEAAFIDAAFEGKHGIPRDCFTVNLPALNAYARSMERNLDRWPGVRAKSTTKVV